jgi:DNA-binding CsgD family transcriptional regulator
LLKHHRRGTKGGQLPGEDHPQAKLTNREVQEMRWLRKYRKWSIKELAEAFDTSEGHAKHIVYRVCWKHLPDLPALSCVDCADRSGENNPFAKLTNDDVFEIRRLYRHTRMTFKEIGERFGISSRHAADICRGMRWAHLPELEVLEVGEENNIIQRPGSKAVT